MKTYLECIPCFMQQALRAGRMSTKNITLQKQILDKTAEIIPNFSMEYTPAEYGSEVYRIIKDVTGISDPYKKIKNESIKEAIALTPYLKEIITKSENRLLTAVRIAIAGNIIDFGVNETFSLKDDIEKILIQNFAISDFNKFKSAVENAKNILYIGDNAGESVFDKLLIEEIGNKDVFYAVREIPIINDCVYEDAVNSGLDDVTTIFSSGVKAPGTIMNQCNEEFMELFQSIDLVISKGQGNYEGLSDVKRPLFFLLKAKCEVIAKDLGVKKNDIILKGINLV